MSASMIATLVVVLSVALRAGSDAVGTGELRNSADRIGLLFGSALQYYHLTQDSQFNEFASKQFNIFTAEYEMKFGPLQPSQNSFDWSASDYLVRYAAAHSMKIRGHCLLWHTELPTWLCSNEVNGVCNATTFGPAAFTQAVQSHIASVAQHFAANSSIFYSWDVQNEALTDSLVHGVNNTLVTPFGNVSLWDDVLSRTMGPLYVVDVFRWAANAFAGTGIKLFYNDYNIETIGFKSNQLYTLVRYMQSLNVPIHGIGMQMHTAVRDPVNVTSFYLNARRFIDLGLEVHITEMDVSTVRVSPPMNQAELFARQASIYGDVLSNCIALYPGCKAFVTWGFTDKFSWLISTNSTDRPLYLNETYAPKPAYTAINQILLDHVPSSACKSAMNSVWAVSGATVVVCILALLPSSTL